MKPSKMDVFAAWSPMLVWFLSSVAFFFLAGLEVEDPNDLVFAIGMTGLFFFGAGFFGIALPVSRWMTDTNRLRIPRAWLAEQIITQDLVDARLTNLAELLYVTSAEVAELKHQLAHRRVAYGEEGLAEDIQFMEEGVLSVSKSHFWETVEAAEACGFKIRERENGGRSFKLYLPPEEKDSA